MDVSNKTYSLRVVWERARFMDIPMDSREELAAADKAVHEALTAGNSFARIVYYREFNVNISLQGFMATLEIEQAINTKGEQYVH